MATIEEIEDLHIEHRLQGLSESFVFKPAVFATYGQARKEMGILVGVTGITGLSTYQKEIVARWSLVSDQEELDSILTADEQLRVSAFHNSHIKTLNCNSYQETNSLYYSKVSKEMIYDGTSYSEILQVNAIARANSLGDSYSLRLYDVNNNKIIAEQTGLTNTDINIIDLGEILYHPTNKTVLELQVKKDAGSDVIISESFEMKFI